MSAVTRQAAAAGAIAGLIPEVCAIVPVGDHLQVMLRAGLVEAARSGRSVIHQRTRFGDSLVSRTTQSE